VTALPSHLENLLERPDEAPFYDLLGGLADNLLTIGLYAGTFLSCDACGDTFSLKGGSWKCEHCGQLFAAKFSTPKKPGKPYEARVTGITNSRWNPHWYYENENWAVAEFLSQLLRLSPEELLPAWLNRLGVPLVNPATLESVLCWPRFRFGGKSIQPDIAMGFRGDVVLIEFKRPAGGIVPPVEVLGQLCFASSAAQILDRRWHLIIVPGRDSTARLSASDYVREALGAVPQVQEKWAIPAPVLDEVRETPVEFLTESVHIFGWEKLLRITAEAIRSTTRESWTKTQTLSKLRYFQESRSRLGLLSAPILE